MGEKAFVLIVDSDRESGNAIAETLSRAGNACKVVGSGAEAIDSVKQRPPDVVVTDFALNGDMNGMDVLRRTKLASPDTEVLLVTARGSG